MTLIKLDCNADHDVRIHSSWVSGEVWVLIDNMTVEFSFKADMSFERYKDYDGQTTSEITGLSNFELSAGDAWLVDSDGDTIDEISYEFQQSHKQGVIDALHEAVRLAEEAA